MTASPTPEEALRFLEAECLYQFAHDEDSLCNHCDGSVEESGIRHADGCPVAKRVALIRQHLAPQPMESAWQETVPETELVWVTNWVTNFWVPNGAWSGPYLLDRVKFLAGHCEPCDKRLYFPGPSKPPLPAAPQPQKDAR